MRMAGLLLVVCFAPLAVAQELVPLEAPRPALVTNSVTLDRLIEQELAGTSFSPERTDDPTFLRRVTLDLIGRQPTIAEQRIFENDTSPDKRQRLIERLLADSRFGTNWANYWSDTIAYRVAPPQLTYLEYGPFKHWLAENLNQNRPWDEIVTEILTASGEVKDVPAATFVAYHQAEPAKLAAETARIFLGMQIQCAECHDHPFDDWKREQFHSLAAYFARANVKMPWNNGEETVVSSKEKGEYTMPDVVDPSKKGKEMQPVFLAGETLEGGQPDAQRRTELARLLTDQRNRWFARAFINRLWDRVAGAGFYSPVDNMGVNQAQFLPSVHEALTEHFLATNNDVKSLIRVVVNTQYYQQAMPVNEADTNYPFATLEQTRLRGDEVFDSLELALNVPIVETPTPAPTKAIRFPEPIPTIQDVVAETYGYDPSFGPKLVQRNMSQAMLMMNNTELQQQVSADPKSGTVLSKILQEEPDNDKVVVQLYELMLARKPTKTETAICQKHLKTVGKRGPAFEDLLWSLMNSTEFTTRR